MPCHEQNRRPSTLPPPCYHYKCCRCHCPPSCPYSICGSQVESYPKPRFRCSSVSDPPLPCPESPCIQPYLHTCGMCHTYSSPSYPDQSKCCCTIRC